MHRISTILTKVDSGIPQFLSSKCMLYLSGVQFLTDAKTRDNHKTVLLVCKLSVRNFHSFCQNRYLSLQFAYRGSRGFLIAQPCLGLQGPYSALNYSTGLLNHFQLISHILLITRAFRANMTLLHDFIVPNGGSKISQTGEGTNHRPPLHRKLHKSERNWTHWGGVLRAPLGSITSSITFYSVSTLLEHCFFTWP